MQLPFIGNLHQIARSQFWDLMAEWSQRYGPVASARFGQQDIIILGGQRAARDLLDKRSAIYSSRPPLRMATETFHGPVTGVLPYSHEWRVYHRIQVSLSSSRAIQLYKGIYDVEGYQLIHDLLSTNDYAMCLRRYASGLAFALSYGKRMEQVNEPEVLQLESLLRNFLSTTQPGHWIVDAIPALRYLPYPLCHWKQAAKDIGKDMTDIFLSYMSDALERQTWSWSRVLAQQETLQTFSRKELAYIIGEMYGAAAFSSTHLLVYLVQVLIQHPDQAKLVRNEVDRVVGTDRLPGLADLQHLPHTKAFINESLRWLPSFGLPHAVTEEDEYMGYRIPKDAMIFTDYWDINRDPEFYPDFATFRLQRYIDDPKLPMKTFGFGRRVCPGQFFALNSLNSVLSKIVWAYDLSLPPHVEKPDKSSLDIRGLLDRDRAPLEVIFTPRSAQHRKVIEETFASMDADLGNIFRGMKDLNISTL
jgi:cytochrome P450